ncbi:MULTISPECIES: TetR/AcrR family transcriptional regulator [unclassified Solwaraspora]|uniref:TetR/AcrR family transcriptional regulator n=1 Tax=unclassified Solwaraspora TaxID=2627926 RepID=UPI00248C2061|nr:MULTISPECIES: TetR/AcrR family transcriptional regulator [unclassified Solwaraspora]WBB99390.1 TetR/AcrR family transcriptional regulator [Solwaraspora sp. WMMA2059]WBC22060.1 TetR/AcrR family transcriptional regulator [Solwaraspora sp. WMMA2080]WJK35894.1 TetR/AcrR family transcriptional regulator [Solwaraspora sp. WMMA2065]
MPRVGLTPDALVDAAIALIDEHGLDALTLSALAGRVGVAAPSLYKHVGGGLTELRTLVAVRVLDEVADELTRHTLGLSRDAAVAALMRASRGYVRRYPARWAAMPADPLREPATAAAGTRLLEVFLAVLRGYGLDPAAAVHATRCLRATVHGFVALEVAGGFGLPEDLEQTYDRLIAMVVTSMPRD